MSLNYPQFDSLSQIIRAEFRRQLPEVDPTVFGSWARSFSDGNAALAQSISYLVRDLEKQLFPQTATDEYLDRWGEYEGLPRKSESSSSGDISLEGTISTVIPISTLFNGGNGISYESKTATTIQSVTQSITSLTRSGSTVTAVLSTDHTLATGLEIVISGATEPEYNGTFTVTVSARDQVQYTIATTPTTPATGSPQYSATYANITIESVETGHTVNLDGGATLTLDTAISGADSSALAQFDGISGGSASEEDEEYRARILLSRSLREGVFTQDQVKLAALSIDGNTRAFVKTPTVSGAGGYLDPKPGQTSIFILRDNDANITPTQTILDETKVAIIDGGAMPANTSEDDVFVVAPTLVATAFDFTALRPDTQTMRDAVESQIQAFFEDSAEFETDITEASYLGSIQSTQDLITGDFIVSFTLSAPSGDITISSGEIATYGAVTFTI